MPTIVHDLAQARAALAAGETPITPPGAAAHYGPAFFRDLPVILDCGDAPGHALAALRAGVKRIRLDAPPEVLAKIKDIAGQLGAEVFPPGGAAPHLDGDPCIGGAP